MKNNNNRRTVVTIGGATQDIIIAYADAQSMHLHTHACDQQFTLLGKGEKIEVDALHYSTGGGATNSGVSFARLGNNVTTCFSLGDDTTGEYILNELAKENITEAHTILPNMQTGTSLIIPSCEGDRTIFAYRGANGRMQKEHLPWELLQTADILYITSLSHDSAQLLPIITSFAKQHSAPQSTTVPQSSQTTLEQNSPSPLIPPCPAQPSTSLKLRRTGCAKPGSNLEQNSPSPLIPSNLEQNNPSPLIPSNLEQNSPSPLIPSNLEQNSPSPLIPSNCEAIVSRDRHTKTSPILIAHNPGSSQLRDGADILRDSLNNIDILVLNSDEAKQLMLSFVRTSERIQDRVNDAVSREPVDIDKEHSDLSSSTDLPALISSEITIEDICFNLHHYMHTVLEHGPKIAVVTDGARGVYVADANTIYFHPSIPAEITCTTLGAGDAFGSCFVASIARGDSIEQALVKGIINASSVISHIDAKKGLLTQEKLGKKTQSYGTEKVQRFTLNT